MSKFYSVTASRDQFYNGQMWETTKYCPTERKAKKILEEKIADVIADINWDYEEYMLCTRNDEDEEPAKYETEDGIPIFYEYRSEMEYTIYGEWDNWYVTIEEKEMEEDEDDE